MSVSLSADNLRRHVLNSAAKAECPVFVAEHRLLAETKVRQGNVTLVVEEYAENKRKSANQQNASSWPEMLLFRLQIAVNYAEWM